ncbi:hypothetical protein OQA88_6240 [Cercophora sp. LCS_1]
MDSEELNLESILDNMSSVNVPGAQLLPGDSGVVIGMTGTSGDVAAATTVSVMVLAVDLTSDVDAIIDVSDIALSAGVVSFDPSSPGGTVDPPTGRILDTRAARAEGPGRQPQGETSNCARTSASNAARDRIPSLLGDGSASGCAWVSVHVNKTTSSTQTSASQASAASSSPSIWSPFKEDYTRSKVAEYQQSWHARFYLGQHGVQTGALRERLSVWTAVCGGPWRTVASPYPQQIDEDDL